MKIKQQAVYFAGFGHVIPTPDFLMRMLSKINERNLGLLPTVVQDMSGQLRLRMASPDGRVEVVVSSGRMDIVEQGSIVSNVALRSPDQFADFSQSCIDAVVGDLNVMAHRLAFVSAAILPVEGEAVESAFNKFLVPLPFYEGIAPIEWTARANVQTNIDFNNFHETVNVIAKIDRAQGQAQAQDSSWTQFDRIVAELDCNTVPVNIEARFPVSSVRAFVLSAGALVTQIEEQIRSKVQ